MKQRRPPRFLPRALAAAALLASAATLYGHDFWLVPDAFQITPGGWLEVRGQTSSRFPTSEAAVGLNRVAEAKLLSAEGEEPIRNLSHAGTSLLLRHRPAAAGQRIVAVTLRPRAVRESTESFRQYLRLEGAPEALERYEREGRLARRDSVTRRYAKYAKTVVEVGGGARAFARTAAHPLEFVPLSDPAALRAGQRAAFRLLYRGRPLAGARLHADAVPATSRLTTAGDHLETDADGVVRVCVDRPGLWNVRTIHVVPADASSGADWDTHWATLVFEVPRLVTESAVACAAPAAAPGRTSADSTEVAATVERFHHALATGDSAGALALLTPDAVVLESGGVESRAEYRSHHLPADIEFARAVPGRRSSIQVRVQGEAAWATSTSTTEGQFRGRTVNSVGAELMVLVRTPAGWRISAIHWSSRTRRS